MSLRNEGAGRACRSATFASVAAATSSTVIAAASNGRVGLVVFNDSTDTLHLLCDDSAAATTSNRTYELGPGDTVEIPFGYSGRVVGIWTGTNGAARVTSFA